MNISQDYVLAQLRTHPDGATIPDLVDELTGYTSERQTMIGTYHRRLTQLMKWGLVKRSGAGRKNDPCIWRAIL